MKLKHHDRYSYSPINERADFSWPDGRRLAFYVALNVEHFSFGEGLGHTPTALGPQPDVRNFGWRDYGLRVGIWRIFDLMDELGLPLCHLINSTVCENHPQIVERIKKRGDDIIGHGRTNSERQSELDEETERALIEEATKVLAGAFGRRPEGWMGPWIAETVRTPDLLKEAGYRYVMDWPADDQPFWLKTRSGPILSVPYPAELNDSASIIHRENTAREFADMIVDQFEEMVEQCLEQPLVCSVPLHPFVAGQPFRLRPLRQALQHCLGHRHRDRVWITRPGEIARYCYGLGPGLIPGPASL